MRRWSSGRPRPSWSTRSCGSSARPGSMARIKPICSPSRRRSRRATRPRWRARSTRSCPSRCTTRASRPRTSMRRTSRCCAGSPSGAGSGPKVSATGVDQKGCPSIGIVDYLFSNMVISRTPLRMSFAGGGTDMPEFFERHGGGAVVSAAIDKYVRVIVSPRFEGDLRIGYSRTEICERVHDIEHDLVREALLKTGLTHGLDVLTLADVPGGGTGMGSSSAVTIGLLNAFHAYRGVHRSGHQLAREACEIEVDILGKPIGYQDQYASAVGRFNLIEFEPGGIVRVQPIIAAPETFAQLHRSLLLFYLGGTRSADSVLANQNAAIRNGTNIEALKGMRALAYQLRDLLGEGDVDGVGRLLHEGWELK